MRSVTFKNLFSVILTYIFLNYCKQLKKKLFETGSEYLNQLIIYKSLMYGGIYLFI